MSKPRRIATDATELGSIQLPQQTETYTVVSHSFIIKETLEQLKLNGFEVDSTEYCRNANGEIALGVYHLTYGNDSDLGLMFTWANSYDKSMRFRCAIGAHVHVSGSRMIAGDMSNYGRIHTGDAKDQVEEHIKSQMASAGSYFTALCDDKDKMKSVILTDDQIAELMGVLYFKENVLISSQLNEIKEEYRKPTFKYTTPDNSLWTIYNHCILALKKSHPKTWMEDQKNLHKIVKARFLEVSTPINVVVEDLVDPAQISLLDQIEDLEVTESTDLVAQIPTTFNLDHIPDLIKVSEELDVSELASELNESDTDDVDDVLIQDPTSLSLDAHSTGIEDTIFPEAPSDLPISGSDFDIDLEIEPEDMIVYPPLTNLDGSEPITQEIATEDEQVQNFNEEAAEVMMQGEPTSMKEVGMEEQQEAEEATPLEEQVAGEHVEPINEAEEEVSAPPIVDEPVVFHPDHESDEETDMIKVDEAIAYAEDEPTQHDLDVQSRLEAEIASENIDSVPEPEDNNSNEETLESPFEF